MQSLKNAAKEFKPKKTLNIADLDKVSVEVEMQDRTFKSGTPDEFTVQVAIVDELEYRVPNIVLAQLQTLLEKYPKMKFFEVLKSGEGQNGTTYQTVPLGV